MDELKALIRVCFLWDTQHKGWVYEHSSAVIYEVRVQTDPCFNRW